MMGGNKDVGRDFRRESALFGCLVVMQTLALNRDIKKLPEQSSTDAPEVRHGLKKPQKLNFLGWYFGQQPAFNGI
jgi:hypothetical protein